MMSLTLIKGMEFLVSRHERLFVSFNSLSPFQSSPHFTLDEWRKMMMMRVNGREEVMMREDG